MNKKELQEKVEKHLKWLRGENGGGRADLRHADLRHVDLRHADLRHAYLQHADLRHADLRHVDLRHADLRHADLRHVDLRHADLRHAYLLHVDLRHVDLRYSAVSNTIIKTATGVFRYDLYWVDDILQVGCENMTHDEWKSLSDEDIQKLCKNNNISKEEITDIKKFVYQYVFKEDVI